MKSVLRVALLGHMSRPGSLTGAERTLLLLAEGIDRTRFEPVLVLPARGESWQRARELGLRTEVVSCPMFWLASYQTPGVVRGAVATARGALGAWTSRELARRLRELAPDVVHVNTAVHPWGVRAAHRLGVPSVWHVHETLPAGPRRDALRRWAARHATRVVAVSGAVAELFAGALPGDRVAVVHNGVPLATVPSAGARVEARRELGMEPDVPMIVSLGQLAPHKGSEEVLEVAHEMARRGRPAQWAVLGRGSRTYTRHLRRRAAALPAQVDLRVPGFVRDTARWLRAADLLLHPSPDPDSLPMAVLEAMVHALPVVATAVGGLPELVDDGRTGLLVAPRRRQPLCDAVERLLALPDLRRGMGVAARCRAEASFSLDRHVSAFEALYDELAR